MTRPRRIIQELTWAQLEAVHNLFRKEELRDAMYHVSSWLILHFWTDDYEKSNALGVLLLTWNNSFYRFGNLDFDLIQEALKKHKDQIDDLRERDIQTCLGKEKEKIGCLYKDLMQALRSKKKNSSAGTFAVSPVSAGKALHLLCPKFFPLWDNKIANAYSCKWTSSERSFESYWRFMIISKAQVEQLNSSGSEPPDLRDIPTLKLIDEYNYMCFTKEKCGSLKNDAKT